MWMKYRHIVWDWNGTLLDDAGFCLSVMNGMLKRRGLPGMSLAFYKSVLEFPVITYYEKIGFDFSYAPFEDASDEYVSAYQAGWHGCALQRGALDTMRELKARGVGQSVLSASKQDYLEEQLQYYGVPGLLDAATGADNHHGRGKIELAREHLHALGLSPEGVLFVGDTQHDAEVAAAAGCDCLLVSFGHYARERLSCLDLPLAEDFSDVLGFINGFSLTHRQ
jgi:phosphoglycolate phosphatase